MLLFDKNVANSKISILFNEKHLLLDGIQKRHTKSAELFKVLIR